LSAAAVNGLNAVKFITTNSTRLTGGHNINTGPLSIFAVVKQQTPEPAATETLLNISRNLPAYLGWSFRQFQSSDNLRFRIAGTGVSGPTTTRILSQTQLYEAIDVSSSLRRIRVDGGTEASQSFSNPVSIGSGKLLSLGSVVDNTEHWNGLVCEVAVYTRALTDREREDLRGYFSEKWGITAMSNNTLPGQGAAVGTTRALSSDDSLVNSLGSQIELAVTNVFDYSGNTRNRVTALFPWENSEKLANPATLPPGNATSVDWSPNGEFLAAAHASSPRFAIYQRTGQSFQKLANPTTLPAGNGNGVSWTADGQFLAVSTADDPSDRLAIYQRNGNVFTRISNPSTLLTSDSRELNWAPNTEFLAVSIISSPYVFIYKRNGTTLTKLSDPSTLPTGGSNDVAWSPNSEFLAVAHNTSPYVSIYQRNGNVFTKLSDPATLPSSNVRGLGWSPNGRFLSLGIQSSPFITTYQRTGTTFTKLSDPATLPPSRGERVSWSPSGDFLVVPHDLSPYIAIYQRSNTTFTKLANPTTLPTGTGVGSAWSSNSEFLVIAHDTPPYITIYQTSGTMPDSGILTIKGVLREGD
jgi:hypothetical protein